ncbi:MULTISPECIES: mercury(II) reductase [Echinicola]|uniref:Mercuric reductase n=2 Tax=Echinicola TaxID=390846 RepID=A0A2Z4IF27_9BACT|nr:MULTISPECIES: mercury(II) reductase [Echinicola]AWW29475.1 mercury(II) reductase [Echinicola strongylocentroti]
MVKIRNMFTPKSNKIGEGQKSLSEVVLEIEGMTCDHCATGIEKKVGHLVGTASQKVNYPEGKGIFSYDPEKVSKKEIIDTINGMGNYSVKKELPASSNGQGTEEEVTFSISGMTCDHCATSIEKRFEGHEGLISKSVSYADEKGTFIFNPDKISRQEIIETINKEGNYKVQKEIGGNGNLERADPGQHDLIIIGGGSAAFSAATTANELGLTVLMVNAGLDIGGTCVNVGCVPSKHLIRAAEQVHRAQHSPFNGVSGANPTFDFKATIQQKKELVAALQKKKYLGVVGDLDNITILEGWARFVDAHTIEVDGKPYKGMKYLLATGATTNVPDLPGLEDVGYLTNETLFDLEEQPEHLIVLGAGYIALEIAQAYHRFGTKVTMLHRSERILRTQAADITDDLTSHFTEEGIEVHTNVSIQKFEKNGDAIVAHTNEGTFEASHVLVATGTRPNTSGLAIENAGVNLNKTGHILVNTKQETNVGHIYAAGDCTDTPAFVYTAAKEGKVAVLNAFQSTGDMVDYTGLPWVVFTDPQIAGAGLDEKEAEEAGIPYETSVMPLTEVPRAQAALDTRGFIKLIRNSETDKLIGGRIIAPEGGELAMQVSLAIKAGMTIQELADAFHPYLTLSEGVKLAAITFNKDVSELSCCAS